MAGRHRNRIDKRRRRRRRRKKYQRGGSWGSVLGAVGRRVAREGMKHAKNEIKNIPKKLASKAAGQAVKKATEGGGFLQDAAVAGAEALVTAALGANPVTGFAAFGITQAIKAGLMPDRAKIGHKPLQHTKVVKLPKGRKRRVTHVFRSPMFGSSTTSGFF